MKPEETDARNERLRRELERELALKEQKILTFKAKMDKQLERLAMDMRTLRKEVGGE